MAPHTACLAIPQNIALSRPLSAHFVMYTRTRAFATCLWAFFHQSLNRLGSGGLFPLLRLP